VTMTTIIILGIYVLIAKFFLAFALLMVGIALCKSYF